MPDIGDQGTGMLAAIFVSVAAAGPINHLYIYTNL